MNQLPSTIPPDELKSALRETSKSILKLLNTLIGFGFFSILALATPDSSLLGANANLRVPIAGLVPFKVFVGIGPFIIIAVRLAVLPYVDRWIALDALLNEKGDYSPVEISPLRHPILRIYTMGVLYLFVPVLLCVFALKGAAVPGWAGYLWSLFGASTALHIYLFLKRNTQASPIKNSAIKGLLICASVALPLITFIFPDHFRRNLELSRANLSNQSYIREDLENANLKDSNLSDSVLLEANISNALLTAAVLKNADLRTADLRRSTLYNTNLEGANLSGAKFEEANLQSASLRNSNLEEARLINANLSSADLHSSNLQRANFKGTNLFLTNLDKADLRNVVNLTCNQLLEAVNWSTSIRSKKLSSCGANN